MKNNHSVQLTKAAALAALTVVAACSSTPEPNADFTEAKNAYTEMRSVPNIDQAAGVQLSSAGSAYEKAEAAWKGGKDKETIKYFSSIATSKAKAAEAVAQRRLAQERIESSGGERAKLLLENQERETMKANAQQKLSQRENQALKSEVASAKRTAASARMQAAALSSKLKELQAEQSDRGAVVTLDGVLFESGSAILKPGANRKLERVAGLLLEDQESKVLIEGFTDATGPEVENRELSERRAKAVRRDLMRRGVQSDRVQARGLGEAFPVASNDTPAGRQQNRRVELVISDNAESFTAKQ